MQESISQQPEREERNLPVPIEDTEMTAGERAKYILATAGVSGLSAAVLGFGELSLVVAAAGGVAGFVFSDNMRNFIIDRLPAPRKARTRKGRLNWWLTGRVERSAQGDGAEDEEAPDGPFEFEDDFEDELEEKQYQTLIELGKIGSQQYLMHINGLLGAGALIAGCQGAGKSNLLGLLSHGASKCGVGVLIIDYKGEFYPVLDVVDIGVRAGHPNLAAEAGERYYVLTPSTALDFADMFLTFSDQGFVAVIDVPSYGGEVNLLAETLALVLNSLMDWSQRQKPADRLPCLIITDEAHNFVPEQPSRSGLRMAKAQFDGLQSAYTRILNAGRSYGFTAVMATQRLTNIAKWSISNLQVKVIMRHTEKNDLDRCEEEAGEVADRATVKAMPKGSGIVIGLSPDPQIVAFKKQPAEHISVTPQIERVHERREQPVMRPRFSRVLADNRAAARLNGVPAPAPARPAPLPVEQVAPAPAPIPAAAPAWEQSYKRSTKSPGGVMQRALAIYQPGMNYRELAQALQIDPQTAMSLLKQLKARSFSGQPGAAPEQEAGEEEAEQQRRLVLVPPADEEAQKPVPTIDDALECWQELIQAGKQTSRNNLLNALRDKGFRCWPNLARGFHDDIREMIKQQQAGG